MLRAALSNKTPRAHYAYISPYRSQAKSIAWEYLKYYASTTAVEKNESDLYVQLVNGARVRLFGADNADAIRGQGFDGVYLDEYGDFKPSVFGNVIRPALSDRQGWCVFGGTQRVKISSGLSTIRLREYLANGFALTCQHLYLSYSQKESYQLLKHSYHQTSMSKSMSVVLRRRYWELFTE